METQNGRVWRLTLETLGYPSEFVFHADRGLKVGDFRALLGSCDPPVPRPAHFSPSNADEAHSQCAVVDRMVPTASIATDTTHYVNVYLLPDDTLTSAKVLPPPHYVGLLRRV